MESFWLAISDPPELPRSKIRSTRAAVSGRERSRATRRRKYSARDTPRSWARWRARRCISVSSVIWVFAIIMAPSYQRLMIEIIIRYAKVPEECLPPIVSRSSADGFRFLRFAQGKDLVDFCVLDRLPRSVGPANLQIGAQGFAQPEVQPRIVG